MIQMNPERTALDDTARFNVRAPAAAALTAIVAATWPDPAA